MKNQVLLLIGLCLGFMTSCACDCEENPVIETITDIDGNVYDIVKIDDQWWMAENLKTTKYNNGEVIASGIYMQGSEAMVNIYGRLYTWYVATDSRNVCPVGWHLPLEVEWNILLSQVSTPAELKEIGFNHWLQPNTGATNTVSFTALPGGYYDGSPMQLNATASFCLKNEASPTTGRGFLLYYNNTPTTGDYTNFNKNIAFSVRCIKD